ncbi:hypothetical protein Mmol_2055 [Methylotenera mobilis JLW8]|uniref:Uracil-DNA glycosylase n=1 Tax=Methylotenera mobilis (strain JLW8 / ATCC BAA-1282 / DSM 17540) TaxID=583345 RepID=C6WZ09_METML|nr:hypothetical protein Mmol_2055 [Methylotenera mobilis JLW8]
MTNDSTHLDTKLCSRCVHYFITYQPNFPYGCKALNFKSRRLPCSEVYEASGKNCLMFAKKPTPQ